MRETPATSQSENEPTVSVVMPAYNAAPFIKEALDSVFAQTFSNFEVIVVNDGSPDSDQIERILQPYLHRITYLKHDRNKGAAAARNLALQHSRGEFLAFLDSDDYWFPAYLDNQLRAFDETPSADLIYSDIMFVGDSGLAGKTKMQIVPSVGPITFESLLPGSKLAPSCAVARKKAVIEVGLFDEELPPCEDYDLWLRIAWRGPKIVYQRKVLACCRLHPESSSSDTVRMMRTRIKVLTKMERTLHLSTATRALVREHVVKTQARLDLAEGKTSLLAGDYGRARALLGGANLSFRRTKLQLVLLGLRVSPALTRRAARVWTKISFSKGKT